MRVTVHLFSVCTPTTIYPSKPYIETRLPIQNIDVLIFLFLLDVRDIIIQYRQFSFGTLMQLCLTGRRRIYADRHFIHTSSPITNCFYSMSSRLPSRGKLVNGLDELAVQEYYCIIYTYRVI